MHSSLQAALLSVLTVSVSAQWGNDYPSSSIPVGPVSSAPPQYSSSAPPVYPSSVPVYPVSSVPPYGSSAAPYGSSAIPYGSSSAPYGSSVPVYPVSSSPVYPVSSSPVYPQSSAPPYSQSSTPVGPVTQSTGAYQPHHTANPTHGIVPATGGGSSLYQVSAMGLGLLMAGGALLAM